MSKLAVLVSLAFLMILFAIPNTFSVASSPAIRPSATTSTNWSGYAVIGPSGSVSRVQGTWIEPSVSCSSKTAYAAFWVGIDGYSSKTVEQTGTLAVCRGSMASYSAWYEFYPAGMFKVPVVVSPGNKITALVSYSGGEFTVKITDVTTGKSFSKTSSAPGAKRSSAEWIAEAPSSCSGGSCRILPLANFGTVQFSAGSAIVRGVSGSIQSFGTSVKEITMATGSGEIKAEPSAISSAGTSFSITWKHS